MTVRNAVSTCVSTCVAAAAVFFFAPSAARADDTVAASRAAAAREMGRPYTMAQLSTGFVALPAALVCLKSVNDCSRGEISLAFGLNNLYRYRAFGFGAGIQWATTLRQDQARGAPELLRSHSRRYFLVQAEARYYFFRSNAWEWWGGVMAGGVVVNDSWSVKADRQPYSDISLIGPRAATVGTEGFSGGIGVGGEWNFARNWSFVTSLRYANWILPSTRKMSPTLDVASLSGRLDMFDVGFGFAYRIAL